MLPPQVLAFMAEKYGTKKVQVQEYPIISSIFFEAVVAAGPPVTYTIAAGVPRTAFSYGINGDMAPAGRAGVAATQADTTIQNAGQTRDQGDVFIYGLSCWLLEGSDPELAGDVMRETDVQIATNAEVIWPAGRMPHYPQPGGLYGAAKSDILIPDLSGTGGFDGGAGVLESFMTNGNPSAGSFRRFENPIFWTGLAGGTDNNLQIICTPRRAIVKTAALARAAGVAGATFDGGPAVYTPPTAAFARFQWCLHAASVKRRGVNAG